MRAFLLLLCPFATASMLLAAERAIEGQVLLPAAKISTAALRYQQTSSAVVAPDAPTAIVYLEGAAGKLSTNSIPPVTVFQKGFQFTPSLLAIQQGAAVLFANADDDYHHVFSYSKPKEFDLGRYRKDEAAPRIVFDKPGVIRIGCEIHEHMRATILVLETPFFTKTDSTGQYRLVLPEPLAGKFTLKAWVSDKDVRVQEIELKEGAALKFDFKAK